MYCMSIPLHPGDASGDVTKVHFKVDIKTIKSLLKQLYVPYYYISIADLMIIAEYLEQ